MRYTKEVMDGEIVGKSCFWSPCFFFFVTVVFGPFSGHLHTHFCYKSAIFIIIFSFKNSFPFLFFLHVPGMQINIFVLR